MSSTQGPGDRIETKCSHCDGITGHIIVVLLAGKIAKVECCACKSVHKYYAPKPDSLSKSATGIKKSKQDSGYAKASETADPKKKTNSRSKTTKAAIATEQAWRLAIEKPSAPEARPYTMSMTLALGDIIKHPTFGLGSVNAIIASDKAEILFCEGTRLLRYAH